MHNFARSTLSAARSMELTMSAEFRGSGENLPLEFQVMTSDFTT